MVFSRPKLILPKEVCQWIFVVLVVGSLLKILVMPSGCALQLAIFGWIPHFDMFWNDSKEVMLALYACSLRTGRWDSARGVIESDGRLLRDYLMCNGIDDAFGFVGVGVVVRDDKGSVLGVVSRHMFGLFSPHVGECLAVREGTWFALSRGYSSWIVETDAINVYRVVSLVSSPVQPSIEANVIADIRDSCLQVRSGSVCYGSHKGNSIAHFLARLAISSSCSHVWIDCLLKFLSPFVRANIANLE
ncbi:hypothetical protein TIFTF001_022038 [Ficus carica]|uniref:RNase H type-1 domain-containing protein n=1 Tax=Ficus carica TaxID=3494 RepID=A0AA88DCI2_FICCA|nr:hypothetical protein TIFTF001_022038 [Ficus carica]